MKIAVKTLSTLLIIMVTLCDCRSIKPIPRDKGSAVVDSLKRFDILNSRINLDYQLNINEIRNDKSNCKKDICKCYKKQITEITAAFFEDSFCVNDRPLLTLFTPIECTVDKCLKDRSFSGCFVGVASLTGYTDIFDYSNSKGLLKDLIACDKEHNLQDYYKARFKIDILFEFKNEDSRGPICEVQIVTDFFLMVVERKNKRKGKWIPIDIGDRVTDSFKLKYENTAKKYFNEKLKLLNYLHE